MTTAGASGAIYAKKPADVAPADSLCTPVGCVQPELLDQLLVVAWLGVLTLIVVFALVHIRDATAVVDEERSRTRDEADAFARFTEHVAELDVAHPQHASRTSGAVTVMEQQLTDGQLSAIRDAYRDTVMGVPHYDEEYGETLAVNMAAEFGEETATAVTAGNSLTVPVKQALVERGRAAYKQRRDLLDVLDAEADALADAAGRFSSVEETAERVRTRPFEDRSSPELFSLYHRMNGHEDEVERVVADRQRRIQERERAERRPKGFPSVHEYLYQQLPVDYPVLADGANVAEQVREARRDLVGEIAARTRG